VQIILKLPNRGVCLDIGTSPLTFVLPNFFQETHSLDFTDVMSARCAEAGVRLYSGGLASHAGKVTAPVADNSYDCIVFLEVIEHLHLNPIDVISLLKGKLKPGGTLILSTPNMMCFGSRMKMLCNMKLSHFHYPPFAENEHPQHGHRHDRVFMPAEMDEYFSSTGWSWYSLGYHGLEVSDVSHEKGIKKLLSKVFQEPVKVIFPSLRQLMLIQARK
jgi:SAM-dependent methyltransferase